MTNTTLSTDILTSGLIPSGQCWSCGGAATRLDGLCRDCGDIDGDAVPDLNDPDWKGNTKPLEAIFVAPPNAKRVW